MERSLRRAKDKETNDIFDFIFQNAIGNPIIFPAIPTAATMRANTWGVYGSIIYIKTANGSFLALHNIGNVANGNYSEFESDGTLKFNGDATVWDDLRVPAQNTKLNPSKSEPAFEEFTDGLYVLKFDTTNADDESVHFIAQMPHSYKEGSDIYPHLHWAPDSINTGNVRWQFEYIIANIDGTLAATATSETITEPADGTSRKHQMAIFSPMDGSGLTVSHIIICRLTRLSSTDGADTFTGNACFLEFDFHFEKDTVGSRVELTK